VPGTCGECGAALPASGACIDWFHALLAAEVENAELRGVHGLTVMTYYLQHPSLCKPWYLEWGRETMRRIFGDGEPWHSVLLAEHPRGVGRQRSAAALTRRKAAGGNELPAWVVTHPVAGERTVTSVDAAAERGPAAQVEAWARSVAEHRLLRSFEE
jgi:hypothetical protein